MPEIQVSVPTNSTVNEPLLIQRRPHVGINGIFSMWTLFLGLFAGRRGASLVVLGNVADHLESWRQSVGYSFPAVVIDTIWNLVFVIVSVAMLIWSKREKPNVPVRVWICVYALQCVVHAMLVWKEYKRRNRTVPIAEGFVSSDSSSSSVEGDSTNTTPRQIRWERRWERRNTEISYVWWGIGFILMGIGNKHLLHVAPRLFWLTLVFLAIDAFFTAVYILMRCLLLLGVCFCFPFIIVFMYYMGLQEGASEADISVLPKYKFEMSNDEEQRHGRAGRMVPMGTNGPNFSVQRVLTKDADCCICLCSYENGSKLHLLPCNHHFHVACIRKWLKVKANCPLCKYDIAQNEQV